MSSNQSVKPPIANASRRNRSGQWSPGVSGNSSGRPLGSRNQSTLVEELLRSRQEALVEKTIEMALNGDSVALRLCLERLYPVPRDRKIDLPLPAVTNIEQAPAVIDAILKGVGEGEITPCEGQALAGIVETQKRVLEARRTDQDRKEAARDSQALQAELEGKLRRLGADEGSETAAANGKPAAA